MTFTLSVILSCSILLPALVSLIRFRGLKHRYLPLILLLWAGVVTEAASFFIIRHNSSNAVLTNVFSLCEALLLTWQFRRLGLFDKNKFLDKLYLLLQFFYAAWWIFENFIWDKISNVNSWLIIVYSLIIVIMCLDQVSDQMVHRSHRLFRNAEFWTISALMLYSTGSLLTELFYLYSLNYTAALQRNVFAIFAWVNFFCNFILFFALLWMPTRYRFIQQW